MGDILLWYVMFLAGKDSRCETFLVASREFRTASQPDRAISVYILKLHSIKFFKMEL